MTAIKKLRAPPPSTGAPAIAVEIYNRWSGQQEERQHGYPRGTVMYRLIFDPRMSKVWPKLRLGIKQQEGGASNLEQLLYKFFCNVRREVASSRGAQAPLAEIKKNFEAVESAASKLIKALERARFNEQDQLEAVVEIHRLAKARALAASSSKVFERELSKARTERESLGGTSVEDEVDNLLVTDLAIRERERDPRFWPRSVQRMPPDAAGTALRFIRALNDSCLPSAFEKIPSAGVIATLASVALDQEVTVEQIKDSRRRIRAPMKRGE